MCRNDQASQPIMTTQEVIMAEVRENSLPFPCVISNETGYHEYELIPLKKVGGKYCQKWTMHR